MQGARMTHRRRGPGVEALYKRFQVPFPRCVVGERSKNWPGEEDEEAGVGAIVDYTVVVRGGPDVPTLIDGLQSNSW